MSQNTSMVGKYQNYVIAPEATFKVDVQPQEEYKYEKMRARFRRVHCKQYNMINFIVCIAVFLIFIIVLFHYMFDAEKPGKVDNFVPYWDMSFTDDDNHLGFTDYPEISESLEEPYN